MSWHFTDDAEVFADAALPLLLAEPVGNTVALTVLDTVRAGHRWSDDEPVTLAWYAAPDGDQVTGAVLMTPPFGMLLAELPPGTEHELISGLHERGIVVPDVNGTVEVVERFTKSWLAGTELAAVPVLRQRLFRLAGLVLPEPMPPGSARLATRADLPLVMDWMHAFRAEAEPLGTAPSLQMHERRVDLGLLRLWSDEGGEPVAMAGRNVTIGGISRVGPVYTPPSARRHGYAAAVTAVCTRDALEQGATEVILFTDLANPTSNGVYGRLGYVPVEDRLILRFC